MLYELVGSIETRCSQRLEKERRMRKRLTERREESERMQQRKAERLNGPIDKHTNVQTNRPHALHLGQRLTPALKPVSFERGDRTISYGGYQYHSKL